MGYHLISVRIGGAWYKLPHVYGEAEFDALTKATGGCLPLGTHAFHFNHLDQLLLNPVIEARPVWNIPLWNLLNTSPTQSMKLKDKVRGETLPVCRKYGDFVLAQAELGWRFYHVTGQDSSLITQMKACPITLKEACAYVDRHHRHNAAPRFHKFSVCLRTADETEPVGVAIASTPKARHQMDGVTLEINRCCSDPRYADTCSRLYALAIRAGRELGYQRFLTYTLPEESGSSLKAVGFQFDGVVPASTSGWDSPSRPRKPARYPEGKKLRWVLRTGAGQEKKHSK